MTCCMHRRKSIPDQFDGAGQGHLRSDQAASIKTQTRTNDRAAAAPLCASCCPRCLFSFPGAWLFPPSSSPSVAHYPVGFILAPYANASRPYQLGPLVSEMQTAKIRLLPGRNHPTASPRVLSGSGLWLLQLGRVILAC